MKYKLFITDEADADIDEILHYIADTLSNKKAATAFADELDHQYEQLMDHPYLFEESRDTKLRKVGYRRFIVGNYVGLYLVDEEKHSVTIARIFYGRRNYSKYI